MTPMEIRRALRTARREAGISATHLAIDLGIARDSLAYLERDAKFVTRLVDWADMVGCEVVVQRKALPD